MSIWQIIYTVDTLRGDTVYKIILKNYNKQKKKSPRPKIY